MSLVDWADLVTGTNFVVGKNRLAPECCIVRDYRSFADSCDFTNKDKSHTSEVEIYTRQN